MSSLHSKHMVAIPNLYITSSILFELAIVFAIVSRRSGAGRKIIEGAGNYIYFYGGYTLSSKVTLVMFLSSSTPARVFVLIGSSQPIS